MYRPISMYFKANKDGLLFSDDVCANPEKSKLGKDMPGLLLRNAQARAEEIQYKTYGMVYGRKDKAIFDKHHISFDLTFIMKGQNDGECRKTSGHYHAPTEEGVIFPEIYEVIYGKALFVLQKKADPWDQSSDELQDIRIVEVNEGEKILLPAGYGHCSYNIGDDVLVFSDIAAAGTPIDYDGIRRNHGVSYYAMREGDGIALVRNGNYADLPKAKRYSVCQCEQLGLIDGKTLYESFIEDPDRFRYIVEPCAAEDYFEKAFCEGKEI